MAAYDFCVARSPDLACAIAVACACFQKARCCCFCSSSSSNFMSQSFIWVVDMFWSSLMYFSASPGLQFLDVAQYSCSQARARSMLELFQIWARSASMLAGEAEAAGWVEVLGAGVATVGVVGRIV